MRCCVKNKKAEFGFVWFFAIIAGIAILLLSIYGATKIGGGMKTQTDAEVAKKLTILTDPLEAGFTSTTFGVIKFQQNVWIENSCNDFGFGYNSISARSESGIGKKYSDKLIPTIVKEKYVFGKNEDIGKIFYVLSKSFDFPYKISDFIIMISDANEYCFVDAPDDVKEELESLKIPVVSFDNCSDDSVEVCFGGGNCDIVVTGNCESCQNFFDSGVVKLEDGSIVDYVGDLLYPAIFSEKDNYECNVRRLLYRGSVVAKILARKAALMNARGCSTNLELVLYGWSSALENATIEDMTGLYSDAVELEESRKWEVCGVW